MKAPVSKPGMPALAVLRQLVILSGGVGAVKAADHPEIAIDLFLVHEPRHVIE
jgi:hypothetical protein